MQITSHINLLDLIGRDTVLKKVASTRGGEYAGACPFCGGKDRFHVQPNYSGGYWFCRQCGAKGDSIEYVKRRDGVGFKEAAQRLNIVLERPSMNTIHSAYNPNAPHSLDHYAALNDEGWQESARIFCGVCFDQLWGKNGKRALSWLKARGLSETIIELAGLGFNDMDKNARWGQTEVFLDRGIVIPWLIGSQFWRINIRRPMGEPKYRGIKGGANGLYNADAIGINDVVLMTEGEFDALVIQSHVKGITPVATGAVAWARVLRWVSLLSTSQLVLNVFDADEVTNEHVAKAVAWWRENLGNKFIRKAPTKHDVTDMWKAGIDLQSWVEPYSLWANRTHTEYELQNRAEIRAEMNRKYKNIEVI